MKFEFHDIATSFSLLSRLPVGVDFDRAAQRGASAAWAYPLVGLALGLASGVLGWGLLSLAVAPGMTAVAIIAFQVILTGALHEDGLSDMADGLGGSSREKRLVIMKDSRIGAFGAIALVLALLARHSGIAGLGSADLILALGALGAGSRALMVAVMAGLPAARTSGMSASTGQPGFETVMCALSIGAISCLVAFGWFGLSVFFLMSIAALGIAYLAHKQFGGQTGDVLGATQQSAEIIGLAVL